MGTSLGVLLALCLPLALLCFNGEDYIDYYPGSSQSNVILTAPHDGWIKLDSIPVRQKGCYDSETGQCDWHHDCSNPKISRKCNAITHADLHSSVIAKQMRETIEEVTGEIPHLVVSKLHRSRLDPNRFRDDAAQYNEQAGQAYDAFHGKIQQVHDALALKGPAVHFDIHGYTSHNADNWTELGYNIRREDLNAGILDPAVSSIQALAERVDNFTSLVSGEESLGKLFQEEGFRTVPSPTYNRPADAEEGRPGKYFRGGYITRKWGSLEGGQIDCVQIEFPQWIRDDSDYYGPKLGRAMAKWVMRHYPKPYVNNQ